MATSVPVPMAMPRSACASAGASLMPSPTIATTWPCGLQRGDVGGLLGGQDLGEDVVDADLGGDGAAVAALSPVSIQTSSPSAFELGDRLGGVGLDGVGDRDQAGQACRRRRRTSGSAPAAARAVGLGGERGDVDAVRGASAPRCRPATARPSTVGGDAVARRRRRSRSAGAQRPGRGRGRRRRSPRRPGARCRPRPRRPGQQLVGVPAVARDDGGDGRGGRG